MLRNAILGSAMLLAFPLSAAALTLKINGVDYNVTSVNVSSSQSAVVITTNPAIDFSNGGSGGTTPPPPTGTEPPPTSTEPPPTTDPVVPPPTSGGACPQTPAGVTLAGTINWAQPGGQVTHTLGRNETKSFKFTTTGGTAYEGQLVSAETSSNGAYRTMWVSECPGAPVTSVPATCVAEGREVSTLRWTQFARSNRCVLKTNTVYYLNVKSAQRPDMDRSTCLATNCSFFQMTYTNGRP
jgi:hypothetical protein